MALFENNNTSTNDEDYIGSGPTIKHEDLSEVRVRVFRGHQDSVKSCQFFQNNQRLLTSSFDGNCNVWNVDSGDLLHSFSKHSGRVNSAKTNLSNTKLVSSGWDKIVNLWDIQTQQCLWSGYLSGIVTDARFSYDEKCIVVASDLDFVISIWDVRTGNKVQIIKDIHTNTPTAVMFNSRNDRVISSSLDRTTKVYDLLSQQVTIVLKDHTNGVSAVDLTRDERRLATASWDKTLFLYDISTGLYRSQGAQHLQEGHEGCVSCCKFNHDGSILASGSYDCSVVIWDALAGIKELKLQGHEDWVEDICFSSDGVFMASASRDCTVRMWNMEHSDELPMAAEQNITSGVHILQCATCEKLFSNSEMESRNTKPQCVFCRLDDPLRYKTDITMDLPPGSAEP